MDNLTTAVISTNSIKQHVKQHMHAAYGGRLDVSDQSSVTIVL